MTLGSARVPSSSLPSALISRSQTAPSLIRDYVADAEMPDMLPPSLALLLHSMPSASFLCSRASRLLACHEPPSFVCAYRHTPAAKGPKSHATLNTQTSCHPWALKDFCCCS